MRFIFFDVETVTRNETETEKPQYFRLGTANLVNFRETGSFKIVDNLQWKHPGEFFNWIYKHMQKKQTLYILSANIWFDIRNSGLFMWLMNNRWETKLFFNQNMTFICKIVKAPYTIVFLNMQQILPVSVASYGDMINLPKLDLNHAWWNDDDVMEYCQRDTDIITQVFHQWLDFVRKHDLGRFTYTLASQAFVSYRYKFLTKNIYIHRNGWLTRYERKAYYGGRTEIYYQGKVDDGTIYALDVNSMYPHIMRNYPMPVKWLKVFKLPTKLQVRHHLLRHVCIGWCAVETDEPVYPKHHNKRLCFPIGKFLTHLTHPEMVYAQKHGHLRSIYYLAVYKRDYIFTQFVDFFNDLKTRYQNDGNQAYRFMTKRIMNSLYGKFGQRIDVMFFEDYLNTPEYSHETVIDADTQITYKELRIGRVRKIYREGAGDADDSMVAIPAHITGCARMLLWDLMKKAGRENVFYCDTDSIYTNKIGMENLKSEIHPTKLGALSVDGKSENFTIHGPKDYEFGEVTHIKGVKKGVNPLKKGLYPNMTFPGFKSDIRGGLDKPYTIKVGVKRLRREYMKGEVLSNGKVIPFTLNEW